MSWELKKASEFLAHAAEWDTLNSSTYNSPILESRFVAPLIFNFGDGSELLCQYHNNGIPVAMGVIKKNRFGSWSTFQPSQAPIGLWICHPELDLNKLLSLLSKKLPGLCVIFSLLQLDSGLTHRPENQARIQMLEYIQTARINTEIGYEAYNKSRSKNLRKNLRKQHNKLQEKSLSPMLQVAKDSNQVAKLLSEYGELESSGWKSEINTAIHPNNAQGKFYREMLMNFCETGDGQIYKYMIGDQIAAMDLCVSNKESIVLLKTAYNESLQEYSPALLMHSEIFKDIFENTELKTIEFYGKVMDWHTKWSDDFRGIYHLNFYKFSLLRKIHKPLAQHLF